jgi:hypothetical protein
MAKYVNGKARQKAAGTAGLKTNRADPDHAATAHIQFSVRYGSPAFAGAMRSKCHSGGEPSYRGFRTTSSIGLRSLAGSHPRTSSAQGSWRRIPTARTIARTARPKNRSLR